jgi:hypothetical protein
LQRDIAYVEIFALTDLERIGLCLVELIGEGPDLVGSNRERLALEILLEPEPTFAVRVLRVQREAVAILAAKEFGKGKGRLVSRQRVPGHSVDDSSRDGSDGRRRRGNREDIGAARPATAFELIVTALVAARIKTPSEGTSNRKRELRVPPASSLDPSELQSESNRPRNGSDSVPIPVAAPRSSATS